MVSNPTARSAALTAASISAGVNTAPARTPFIASSKSNSPVLNVGVGVTGAGVAGGMGTGGATTGAAIGGAGVGTTGGVGVGVGTAGAGVAGEGTHPGGGVHSHICLPFALTPPEIQLGPGCLP